MSKRVLIIGPAWVGDMVLAQSLFKSLKRHTPDAEIHVAAPSWSQNLLHRMSEVTGTVDLPFGHGELKITQRYRLGVSLRARCFDQAIILPRSYKAALLPQFAAIPVRTAYRGEMRYGLINDMRRLDKRLLPRIIDRFVYLGTPRGTDPSTLTVEYPTLRIDENRRGQLLSNLSLEVGKPILALLPGAAFGKSKQWPPEHFAELGDEFAARGYQIWIMGSQADSALSQQLIQGMSKSQAAVDLCGKTTLDDVIDLLSLARMVVSNDSGLMHVSAAVGCSVIAIYGATAPTYTPPMTDSAKIMYRGIACSPCWQRQCRYGHYRCLTEIAPRQVVREADDLLNRG